MEDNEQAILDWVNTFSLTDGCSSLEDLCDGIIIVKMLCEISPDHFDISLITSDVSGNWVLSANNFKSILRMLQDYYTNVVHKSIDMGTIDVNALAREQSRDELFNILELVVGCAVLSDDKARFIQNIFSLNHVSQTVLKGMVERVMRRTVDIPTMDNSGFDDLGVDSYVEEDGEGLIRARETVRYLQEEKAHLDSRVKDLERDNSLLVVEVSKLKQLMTRVEQERDITQDSERDRAMAVASASANLERELSDCRRELELRNLEAEGMRTELRLSNERLNATREMQARLEVDAQQMADELDLARDKAGQLVKAEAAIDKYQRRLEELSSLKKANQELETKLDVYLDRIAELESSNKNISTLNRMVEQYKDKAVELEREKFEAISEIQMKHDELRRLQSELEEAVEARNFLQDELSGARAELEHYKESHGDSGGGGGGGGGSGLGMFESITSLKEQLKQQELELRVARRAGSGGAGAGAEELALLQAELEDTRRVKREREEGLLACKRQLVEAQQENQKLTKALTEAVQGGGAGVGTAGISKEQFKEMEQQLSMKANTIRQMEGLLREKESDINRVEQEKRKLEEYAKRTLSTFKDKYMQALTSSNSQKKLLEEKVQYMQRKSETDQETHRREERLLLSSMYELGVRMMDRNIQLEMRDSSYNPTTFLANQRAEHDRASLGGSKPSPGPTSAAAPIRI